MKKLLLLATGILLALFTFMQVDIVAKADDHYSIDKYIVNTKVSKSGNANVTQKVTYNFSGTFNGVNNIIDLRGSGGGTDPEVYIQQNGDTRQTFELPDADVSNVEDWLTIKNSGKKETVKVYNQVTDQKVTYIYKYEIFDLVKSYQDTADITWKIIGSHWEVPLNNVRLTVQLPQSKISKLQAWTHGPLAGYTKVDRKNGSVTMSVDQVPKGQFVESRILFPNSVTPTNTNTSRKQIKPTVYKQEKQWIAEANQTRHLHRFASFYAIPLYLVLIVVIAGFIYYKWKTSPAIKISRLKEIHHWFEIPD
ncbi:DUF2207 domain-containing protein [Companilactobacillus ginsenosidimutans]|uniref:DUF2207 domain-containing protein n=1 Tax=Companilactobacillus ginsenosidimutans TaxID=1007676 RepID=A0A0H4R1X8_9LACO|nr:DUF2207 domain-containing protein [Companilactobacillus ginsenosidimutans]AKP67740.1 hypothetical protein ABM34_09510 [Companilactobacillus ginsenosidimutans]